MATQRAKRFQAVSLPGTDIRSGEPPACILTFRNVDRTNHGLPIDHQCPTAGPRAVKYRRDDRDHHGLASLDMNR
jgi:hypothetical protein